MDFEILVGERYDFLQTQYGHFYLLWQFASAVDRMAHFVQSEIGRSATFETVMYLGYPDLRAFIVLIAL
jgi:hypothetical protein